MVFLVRGVGSAYRYAWKSFVFSSKTETGSFGLGSKRVEQVRWAWMPKKPPVFTKKQWEDKVKEHAKDSMLKKPMKWDKIFPGQIPPKFTERGPKIDYFREFDANKAKITGRVVAKGEA